MLKCTLRPITMTDPLVLAKLDVEGMDGSAHKVCRDDDGPGLRVTLHAWLTADDVEEPREALARYDEDVALRERVRQLQAAAERIASARAVGGETS